MEGLLRRLILDTSVGKSYGCIPMGTQYLRRGGGGIQVGPERTGPLNRRDREGFKIVEARQSGRTR